MRKLFPLIILGACLLACSSTKIYPKIKCHVCLRQSDGILLMPLAWDPSFRNLSTAQQNELEQQILENLRNEGFTKVELLDQLDYELLNAGIKDLNDPFQRAKIHTELGYPYLLGLILGEAKWKGEWEFPDLNNPSSNQYWEEDETVTATLQMALVESETANIVSDYSIQTVQNGIPIPIGGGETMDLNFGSISQAVGIATRKGIKNLIKDCSC